MPGAIPAEAVPPAQERLERVVVSLQSQIARTRKPGKSQVLPWTELIRGSGALAVLTLLSRQYIEEQLSDSDLAVTMTNKASSTVGI